MEFEGSVRTSAREQVQTDTDAERTHINAAASNESAMMDGIL